MSMRVTQRDLIVLMLVSFTFPVSVNMHGVRFTKSRIMKHPSQQSEKERQQNEIFINQVHFF